VDSVSGRGGIRTRGTGEGSLPCTPNQQSSE